MKQGNVSGALAKVGNGEQKSLTTLIRESTKELANALPSHLSSERLVRIALTSIRLNPKLAQCTSESFLGALFTLAQIGLEPIAGRAYLLPFANKRKKPDGSWHTVMEVQSLIGYKGIIELFYRHNSATSVDMQTVHEGDDFSYEYGTNSYLRHKPAQQNRGDVIGYYAVAKLQNGGSVFKYMTFDECIAHGKKHSKTYNESTDSFGEYSPWTTEPDAMCMKTVLLQLSKMLPLSVELQRAISVDETSRDYRRGISDALDLPDTTSWEKKPNELLAPEKKEKQTKTDWEINDEQIAELDEKIGEFMVDKKTDKKLLSDFKKRTKISRWQDLSEAEYWELKKVVGIKEIEFGE